MEFYGANSIQTFYTIGKSLTNSYELFYVNRKWPELIFYVTSCDLIWGFFGMRCDFSYLAMNCDYIWYTTT
jgi:hypothetical protein